MARVQKQDHGRDQLVFAQFASVAFGDKELADEIVAKVAAPRAGIAAHEIGERARRLGRAILDRAVYAELIHRHHAMRPVDELMAHVARHAEEIGNDGDGNGASELGDELGRAGRANASIRSCANAAICGSSFSMRRETKARLTRLRSRVCSGGSSSRIECFSSASNGSR